MAGIEQFSGVVFDMDGLLLDSERLARDAFLRACERFEVGDRSDIFQQCIGVKWESCRKILVRELGRTLDVDRFAESWNENYQSVSRDQPIPLKPGVREILLCIQKLDLPMVVATSTRTESAESKLSLAEIRPFFREVIGGDQVRLGKPDPEIYLRAAESLGLPPEQCLAFEDSEIGTRAALASGMTVVQIPDLVEPSRELRELGPIILKRVDAAIHYSFPDLPVSE